MATLTTAASAGTCFEDDSEFQPTSCHDKEFYIQSWKAKAAQSKKVDFIREADKLKNQIAKLEKDRNVTVYNKKNDFRNEFGTLEEVDLKMMNNRKSEKDKLQQQLVKIHNSVKRFQRQLQDVKPTPDYIGKLKEVMEEVENSINNFKEEQRQIYEELLNEEKTCAQEILALEKKIDTWASAVAAPPQTCAKVPLAKSIEENLPAEVAELEKFLQQTGGRQGGWDDFDHQNFLRVWTKHSGKPAYLKEALMYLPGRTEEEIKLHENWYQEFLFLEERKKEAIAKWKSKRRREKEELLQQKETSEGELARQQAAREEARRKREEQERREKEAQLQDWRGQKEQQRRREEQRRLREEALRRRREKEERRRQLEARLAAEEYARQKREREDRLRVENELRERAELEEKRRQAASEIVKFQERDLLKLEVKLQEKQAKEEDKAEREKRLAKLKEKVEAHISRDPSRLWKPTKGWEERTKEIGPTGGGPVLHLPHRAVPSWRQGI
ncbi:coiled-coil domain-containing protein 112 isoform X2 [Lepisosteus oculatus]|uniref:coiled-coil domain-containing protein 112 isoform X2 n=1 Tax=Lepisosteus oculatus TaxID=7918 RepID=UPI00371FC334